MQIFACPTCKQSVSIPENGGGKRVQCPKCKATFVVPVSAGSQVSLNVLAAVPGLTNSPSESGISSVPPWISWFPLLSILLALLALALPIFLRQYIAGLIAAILAMGAALTGCVLFFTKRGKGPGTHLVGLAVALAGLLLAINALLLRTSIENNAELLAKNEKTAAQSKADLEDAKKKLAEVEDAPRKAADLLNKAKESQEKTEAAEKRTVELVKKAEDLERKNELDGKKLGLEKAKLEETQDKLKALQKAIEETKSEVDERKKEIAEMQKKTESDRLKAEQKNKEAQELLKKVENVLKGAALQLKSKNPEERIKTAKALARLHAFPEAKILSEPLVQAMMDPLLDVRKAAAEALEKTDPLVQPHVFTLLYGEDKFSATMELKNLGKQAKAAIPALLHYHQTGFGGKLFLNRFDLLDVMTAVAPQDKRVGDLILSEIAKANPSKGSLNHLGRQKGLKLLDSIEVDNNSKLKALLIALKDGELAGDVIDAIGNLGADAAGAIPQLRELKLSPFDSVRVAATKALKMIETTK